MSISFILFTFVPLLTKTQIMTKEESTQLMKLIYKLDVLGDSNSIVRSYYDINTKKEWRNFINNHIKLLNN